MYLLAATQKTTIATSLIPTMILLAPADSRIPRTSRTVSSMTIKNPSTLKCHAHPTIGSYAGEAKDGGMCSPKVSRKLFTYAEKPTATAMFDTAYSRIKSQPIIHAMNSPIVAYVYVYALPAIGIIDASSA